MRVAGWVVLVAAGLALAAWLPGLGAAQDDPEPVVIVVTNAGDSIAEGEAVCPSETLCTLRRAIELANSGPPEETPTPEPTTTPDASETVESTTTPDPSVTPASTTTPDPTETPELTTTPESTTTPDPSETPGSTTPEPTATATASPSATPGDSESEASAQTELPETVIVFDPAVFPAGEPVVIFVSGTPLPAIEGENTHIDGSGAGVVINGSLLEGDNQPGLRFLGGNQSMRGVAVEHFTGTCVESMADGFVLGGDPGEGEDVAIGDCKAGVALGGDGARVNGVSIGVGADLAVETGMLVTGSNAIIGDDGEERPWPNAIGQAVTAIRIGGGATTTDCTLVARNTFGEPPGENAASVTYGIVLQPPATGSVLRENAFDHVLETAIVAGPPSDLLPNDGHTFDGNFFGAVGLAIDLNNNAIRDPNDPNDSDGGANTTLNHPILTKATTGAVQGSAGVTCPGCTVEIYRSNHVPGGLEDLPTEPVATATTDGIGTFTVVIPGLDDGEWLSAIATDANGNTSEFGPSARVGSGLVECGATQLVDGWNHSAYFGPNGTVLGDRFPATGPGAGRVLAVYKLVDGTTEFLRWGAGVPVGNTLLTLEPGETYFFLADGPVSLPGGFALTVPYPVSLEAGWNDFVYIGGEGHYLDAFGPANAVVSNTYRFVANGTSGKWQQTGPADLPEWRRDFTGIATCSAYEVFATGETSLNPLQP